MFLAAARRLPAGWSCSAPCRWRRRRRAVRPTRSWPRRSPGRAGA